MATRIMKNAHMTSPSQPSPSEALDWSGTPSAQEAAQFGVRYYIFRNTTRIIAGGCDYSLRIEFDGEGGWIRSQDVLDSVDSPTICKEQAEKIARAIRLKVSAALREKSGEVERAKQQAETYRLETLRWSDSAKIDKERELAKDAALATAAGIGDKS